MIFATQSVFDAFVDATATPQHPCGVRCATFVFPPGVDITSLSRMNIRPGIALSLNGKGLRGTDALCTLKADPATCELVPLVHALHPAFSVDEGVPELVALMNRVPCGKLIVDANSGLMDLLASTHGPRNDAVHLVIRDEVGDDAGIELTPERLKSIIARRSACRCLHVIVNTARDPSRIMDSMVNAGYFVSLQHVVAGRTPYRLQVSNVVCGVVTVGPIPIQGSGDFIASLQHLHWAKPKLVLEVKNYAEDAAHYVAAVGPMLRARGITAPFRDLHLLLPDGRMDVGAVFDVVACSGAPGMSLLLYKHDDAETPEFACDVVALARRLMTAASTLNRVLCVVVASKAHVMLDRPTHPWSMSVKYAGLALHWKCSVSAEVRHAVLAAGVQAM